MLEKKWKQAQSLFHQNNFMKLKLLFQVFFYCGSFVSKHKYTPFLDLLRRENNCQVTVLKSFDSIGCVRDKNDSILIGHSLGGVSALYDALRFGDNVKGVILLQSHLNSRNKMPYPGIPARKVNVPLLTILAGKDGRLPIQRSIDDLYEKVKRGYNNHFYIINKNFSHFTGVVEGGCSEKEMLINQTTVFIRAVSNNNFTKLRQQGASLERRLQYNIANLTNSPTIHSDTFGVIDALLSLVLPQSVWRFIHWTYFVESRVEKNNHHMYEDDDHIFWKSSQDDVGRIHKSVDQWMFDKKFQVDNYIIPTFPMFWPLAFFVWSLFPTIPYSCNDTVIIPMITMKVFNTTHYKLPHPHTLFHQQNPLKLLNE